MSLFYNNDPFWNFFDTINEEVNNLNSVLNRTRPKSKQLTNNNNNSKEVAKKEGATGNNNSRPWALDPFFTNNSLFNFADTDFVPPVDLIDKEKAYELHVSVPGAPKENISIDFSKDDNQLIIKGTVPSTKPAESEDGKDNGDHYFERSSGNFERRITLPVKIDGDNIKASFENGVLKLEVPKVSGDDKNKFKRIEITSSESYSS